MFEKRQEKNTQTQVPGVKYSAAVSIAYRIGCFDMSVHRTFDVSYRACCASTSKASIPLFCTGIYILDESFNLMMMFSHYSIADFRKSCLWSRRQALAKTHLDGRKQKSTRYQVSNVEWYYLIIIFSFRHNLCVDVDIQHNSCSLLIQGSLPGHAYYGEP